MAIAKACKKKLLMAGIIQDQNYYKEYIAPQIDNETVIYVGSVGPVERNLLLGKAIGLLHPIQFDEPFGLSVIESMAYGTPTIAMNRGSMSELIENNLNGYLVENVDEAIEAVSRIHEINREYCRHCAEEHFTVNLMVNNYLQVYKEILDARRLNTVH